MKKAILILVAIGVAVAAYCVGYSRGRSSGFWDGAVWTEGSADMCTALRAKWTLDLLEQTNYPRVAETLNHDIDYAIIGVIDADKHLANVRFPRNIREMHESSWETFKPMGIDENTGHSYLADFRRKHPTHSTNEHVVKAVNELLEKY